ncbi:MAG: UDP-N-acetylmuramate dehydrogenase [Candidatus Adiutrix sp.]|jgi:UDP-N-acetylmuramate dehydrogenase|nr:UDP-N-acetylmuramate dehydrogenase [Candidatus Adiutrix sp.]
MSDHSIWGPLARKMAGRLSFNVPLKDLSTFGLGGPAAVLAGPETVEELAAILDLCRTGGLRYYILGAGSNILFLDEGFDGAVIRLGPGFKAIEHLGGGLIRAGAAAGGRQLLEAAAEMGLSGLECLVGIPCSVGGAVYMNAGSSEAELGQVVSRIFYLRPDGHCESALRRELDFAYRGLRNLPAGAVILGAEFQLSQGRREEIQARVRRLLAERDARQPRGLRSAGSVFKNPPGLSAGKLIDDCGFKGRRLGSALVSEIHANIIVNPGGAQSSEILELMRLIQAAVREKHGVRLEPEIKIVGRHGEVDGHETA